MTKFRFTCPVCLIGVNGRNIRRHVRKVHGREVPLRFAANARRRSKELRRSGKGLEAQVIRAQVWVAKTTEEVKKLMSSEGWVYASLNGESAVGIQWDVAP